MSPLPPAEVAKGASSAMNVVEDTKIATLLKYATVPRAPPVGTVSASVEPVAVEELVDKPPSSVENADHVEDGKGGGVKEMDRVEDKVDDDEDDTNNGGSTYAPDGEGSNGTVDLGEDNNLHDKGPETQTLVEEKLKPGEKQVSYIQPICPENHPPRNGQIPTSSLRPYQCT